MKVQALLVALFLSACTPTAIAPWKGVPQLSPGDMKAFAFKPTETLRLTVPDRVVNWTDVSQGQQIAPAYLELSTTNGERRYARVATLSLAPDGFLVETHGHRLSPPLQVPPETLMIWVQQDGIVSIQRPAPGALEEIGVIMSAQFADPAALQAAEDGLFLATAASGQAEFTRPTIEGHGPLVSPSHVAQTPPR